MNLSGVLLAGPALICFSGVSAYAQPLELQNARLLDSPDGSAQTAVFEVVNVSNHAIGHLAVSCHLLDRANKALAVKVVRLRNLPLGSTLADAEFPSHVRGADASCRIVHYDSR